MLTVCDGSCGLVRACSSGKFGHFGALMPCADFGMWGGKKKRGCDRCSTSGRECMERTVGAPARALMASAAERGTPLLDLFRTEEEKARIWNQVGPKERWS